MAAWLAWTALGGLLTLVGAGCSQRPETSNPPPVQTAAADRPADAAQQDSAFAVLTAMQRSAFQQAFDRLTEVGYMRLTRTEQLRQDTVIAFEERVLQRRPGGPPTVVEADSGGSFAFGALGLLVTSAVALQDPADPVSYVLPDDPPFLSARNREAFTYDLRSDTLLFSRPTRVVTVRAQPGTGDRQAIRYARLYIDRATGQLVGLYLERTEASWFFREASRFFVRLRPAAGDPAWLPLMTRFQTAARLPFSQPQQFRTTSTYYDYDPAG